MKSVRINLIARSELRYQGAVSPKFLVITLGSALIAALLLLLVVRSVQYVYRNRNLTAAREVWSGMAPRYQSLQETRAALARQQSLLRALKERQEGTVRWADFLLSLQLTVPEKMSLSQLQLSVMGSGQGQQISIRGQSQGDDAEAVVIAWRKMLLETPDYLTHFDSLELKYLRSSGRKNEGTELRRDFELSGERRLAATKEAK